MRPSKLAVLFSAILAGGLALTGCSDDSPPPFQPPPPPPPPEIIPLRTETFAEDVPRPPSDLSYWPRLHGPAGDNISTDTGLLTEWPEGGPTLVWTTTGVGHGYSSVSLAHGRIYVDGTVGSENAITAMDLGGTVLWQKPTGPGWIDAGKYPGGRATPTVDEGRIYHESPSGDVVCLDAESGDRIWGLNILDTFEAENIRWALAESVLVDGDNLICCPGGKKASVAALDKNTGEVVWAAPSTGRLASHTTIAVAEHQGLRMILAMTAESLIGVNAESGDLLFEYEHLTDANIHVTTPIFHDGRIFITSGYGSGSEMLQLEVRGDQATVEQLWECKTLDNQHHGVVLLDGHLYGCAFDGKWICLDWQTGDVKYSASGVGKGSITAAEGMLYTLSERRRMGLVPATPDGHTVVSRFEVPSGGEGFTWAHPVVCGRRLYLRHGQKVYAYDIRAEAPGE